MDRREQIEKRAADLKIHDQELAFTDGYKARGRNQQELRRKHFEKDQTSLF